MILENYFISNYSDVFNSKTNKFVMPFNELGKFHFDCIIYIVSLK